ncbi:hypothetical protein F4X86_04485 [Candidatus Saccharibacteria bacterium]|nr:hypothetical protein [Candidatus Saccharibacteria bacterium]
MTEKPRSERGGEDRVPTPDAGARRAESQLTEGDWQSVHEHLREIVWDPADKEAEKLLEELSVAGRDLLAGLPGTPLYELGRRLQESTADEPATSSGDEFGRRLVDLLLAGQRDPGASAALAGFLAGEASAARLAESSRAAEGKAQAAEESYNNSYWDAPLYDGSLHSAELTHLGHRWQLARLEAAFWSALSDQSGDHLKWLAETARSFQEEAGEYERFLTETSLEAGDAEEE